jgi:peptidoglycan/LPS O-acetylase OafA/YrhL
MQNIDRHVPVLDAVRGLAISLVLFIHIGESVPAQPGGAWTIFRSIASSSWVGVDLFFVLSGFLITGILYDTMDASNFFKAFYARRFLRIFPLYYGFLILLFLLTGPLQIDWHGRQWVYLLYLQNTRVVKDVQSAGFSPYITINHLWSLAVEEQFYFVWPAVVFLIRDRSRLLRISALLIVGSMVLRVLMLHGGRSLWMIYIFTPARADTLMIGSALALLFRGGPELPERLRKLALFVLPCCLVGLLLMALPTRGLSFSSRNVIIFGYTMVSLASASVMTLSLTDQKFRRVLDRSTLRWLGKCSYGIYVLHLPVMMLLLRLNTVSRLEDAFVNPFWKVAVVLAASAVSVGVAFLSFNLYESRFLKLKQIFRYQFPERGKQARELIGPVATCTPES